MEERYERGLEKLGQVDAESGKGVIESMQEIAPALADYIIEFAFGDIYSRRGLTLEEREIITLASLLTAGGCEAQLDVHINGALNVGVPKEKIVEIFLQCIPYTGFPKVLNAVNTAKKVFGKRK
ncbi:carboxymuconolactone decarboxylase family protein [Christensenella intestinihominis]|uniref:carboxymuconolactone decarboxylase family protein n=1 Tax=Christensenella intestinihominis TaxID=1851429 RepID=UPI0008313904|nr:carboxymuconolactone decarboxylase family protein [Christensenella intestinihominis]